MRYEEFSNLLSGINENTALGRVVAIRAEKDPKIIKEMSPEQKRIREEWEQRNKKKINRTTSKPSKEEKAYIDDIKSKLMFYCSHNK